MVLRAKKLTPEVLLGAPRRGAAVPNHDGSLALYDVSTYSFEEKTTTKEIRIMDIETGSSTLFIRDQMAHDAVWLNDGTNAIMWLKSGAAGITSLMIGDGDDPSKASYTADVILAPFENLKVTSLEDGAVACAMTGLATPKGSLYNAETAEKPLNTGRIYDKANVRFWNKYHTPERTVIWYSRLGKSDDGLYSLAAPVHNCLKGTKFEAPIYDGIGSSSNEYDIGPAGIIFNACDPDAIEPNPYTSTSIYFIPLKTFTEVEPPKPKAIHMGSYHGPSTSPRFSPSGSQVAFLKYPTVDSSYLRLMLVADINDSLHSVDVFKSLQIEWNLAASGISWANDAKAMFLTADDCGRISLFRLSLKSGHETSPKPILQQGAVSACYNLADSHRILVSSSSYTESSLYQIIDSTEPRNKHVVSSQSKDGSKLGISPTQVSEMWYEGGGEYYVQAWVVKPSFFDESKKYPLALFMHGGPKDAWRNSWSTRWNPAAWAEQGYVVVLPNFTGSRGFSEDFIDGINGEWGGRPYKDLEKCFTHVKKNMTFIDTDNAIAAGASYGGYLANWVQGNALGRSMKAIVCHDGIFDLQMMIASDSVGGDADFLGPMYPWANWKNIQQWNPARPDLLKNWDTPMLIIHSSLDYRCDITNGIASFHTCQFQGVPSRYLNFPDEGHFVLKPENSLLWHDTVFDWINKYSGVTKAREERDESIEERVSHIEI